jgi:hypothetical protein
MPATMEKNSQITTTQTVIGKIRNVKRDLQNNVITEKKAFSELAKIYKSYLLVPRIPPLRIPAEDKALAVFAWQIINGEADKVERRKLILRHLLNK